MMMLGHGKSSSPAAAPHVIKHHPFGAGVKKHATVPVKRPSTARAKSKSIKPTTVKPKTPTTVVVAPKAAEQRSTVLAAIAAGLPNELAAALGRHPIVVVAVYNPYSQVDGIAFAEARAGAKDAGAGFIGLNVLSQAQVGKLTQMLGLLPDPGLLVYTRPGTLVARISGFADKETVAQAAQNAAHGT